MKQKNQKPLIAVALAAIAFTANPANAAVLMVGDKIGVDFGPTAPANFFNQVNPSPAGPGSIAAGGLINTTNVSVDGVGFSWSATNAFFNNTDSLENAAQPADFVDSNTTDWLGISNQSAQGTPGIITLTFTGLNDLFTYNLVIGARFGTNIASTSWTVDGQTLLATSNTDNAYRFFENLSTDGAGNLVMTGTGAVARLDIAAVSALQLTAIPEPSAALLGGLGLLALLRRRR